VRRVDVQIPAPDGRSHGTLHLPEGDGPWPGVLVFPDAGGVRETFRQMGDRLAGMGYVALIPDIYYRAGEWAPFDVATLFTDKQQRARLLRLMGALTNERIIADAGAYSGFLLARPEVTGSAIGTTGYCLGGRMSLIAAGGLGRVIAAAASFHGGRLAVAGDPSSPHLSAGRVTAVVYVAGAKDDNSFTAGRPGYWNARLPTPESTTPLSSIPPATDSRCPTTRRTTLKQTPGTGKRSAGSTGLTSKAPEAESSELVAPPVSSACGILQVPCPQHGLAVAGSAGGGRCRGLHRWPARRRRHRRDG
jgi:carboxymethylenebutenolidase